MKMQNGTLPVYCMIGKGRSTLDHEEIVFVSTLVRLVCADNKVGDKREITVFIRCLVTLQIYYHFVK